MVIRESYLKRIRPFYHKQLIKVIVGVRRCGKSVLLNQMRDDIKASGVSEDSITLINFELYDNKPLRNADTLYEFIASRMEDGKKHYVFLDEVQLVDGFEDVVNSLQAGGNASVFITGSNSKLLAGEMATLLSGRYVSFQIMPFTFNEYRKYRSEKESWLNFPHDFPHDYAPVDEELGSYLTWGGFPAVCEQNTDAERSVVIDDLYASIVLRAIMDRNAVSKGEPLQNVLDFLIANSSSLVSGKRIADTLTSNGMKMSTAKIYEYMQYIEDAFIVTMLDRYNIAGKMVLKYEKKAFVCDLGFFHAKKSRNSGEFSRVVETVVCNELLARGYKVYVGKTQKGEIDFVVMQGDKRCYIQVAYLMQDEATINREFGAFRAINDSYPKYVISMDPITNNIDGIQHLKLIDFLQDESLLRFG